MNAEKHAIVAHDVEGLDDESGNHFPFPTDDGDQYSLCLRRAVLDQQVAARDEANSVLSKRMPL